MARVCSTPQQRQRRVAPRPKARPDPIYSRPTAAATRPHLSFARHHSRCRWLKPLRPPHGTGMPAMQYGSAAACRVRDRRRRAAACVFAFRGAPSHRWACRTLQWISMRNSGSLSSTSSSPTFPTARARRSPRHGARRSATMTWARLAPLPRARGGSARGRSSRRRTGPSACLVLLLADHFVESTGAAAQSRV
jgi:hypothetical protein